MSGSVRTCCVPKCGRTRTENTMLYSFPHPEKDSERFITWVKAVGSSISSLDHKYIYKNRKICSDHFDNRNKTWKGRLSNIAVPTFLMPDKTFKTIGDANLISETTTDPEPAEANQLPNEAATGSSGQVITTEVSSLVMPGLDASSAPDKIQAESDEDNDKDDSLPEICADNVSSTSIDNELSSEPENSRAIIARVYHYLQKEYECLKALVGGSCDVSPFADILRRTAEATGVTEKTVTSVLQESKCAEQHDDLDNNTSTQERWYRLPDAEQNVNEDDVDMKDPLDIKDETYNIEDTPKMDTPIGDDVYILDLREKDAVKVESENGQCSLKKNSQLPSGLIKPHFLVRSALKSDGTNDILSKLQRCRWCSVRKRGYNKNLWMCKQCKVSLCLNKCFKNCCRVP